MLRSLEGERTAEGQHYYGGRGGEEGVVWSTAKPPGGRGRGARQSGKRTVQRRKPFTLHSTIHASASQPPVLGSPFQKLRRSRQPSHPSHFWLMSERGNFRGGRGGGRGGGEHRGGRGGGRGGAQSGQTEKPKKENILDLSKYMDKQINVKFNGGREGKLFVCASIRYF